MKKISILLWILCLTNASFAQFGFKGLSFSTGWTTANSKVETISIEGTGEKKLHLGVLAQSIFYNNSVVHGYTFESQKTYVAVGLFLKYNLFQGRNCVYNFTLGAAGGSDNSQFMWYPFGGFEQSFFVAPKTQLFLSEQAFYLFLNEDSYHWQPALHIGLRLSI